jgi:uncharacterized RDD family membrane protein YckC
MGAAWNKDQLLISLLANPSKVATAIVLGLMVASSAYWIINGWFRSNHGGGPGKCLLGLAVRHQESGEFIGWNQAALRESVGKLISVLPFGLGFIVGFFRSDRRMFHDFLSSTKVVNSVSRLSTKRVVLGFLAVILFLGIGLHLVPPTDDGRVEPKAMDESDLLRSP